jgi:hypothetical protein
MLTLTMTAHDEELVLLVFRSSLVQQLKMLLEALPLCTLIRN